MVQRIPQRQAKIAATPALRGGGVNDNHDLVIDLFAGGGGASLGLSWAGFPVDIAVNHDEEAVALHAENHPGALHLCEDIRKVDIVGLLTQPKFAGRRVGILWASPDCKHHSKAAGGKPKDKNIRGLAWEVQRWVANIRRATGHPPRLVCLENVEEFQDWCPVHIYGAKAGRVQKRRMGETFNLWVSQLKALGAQRVEWRELVAAEHGVPTTRKRLYLVAIFDDYEADWQKPTHAPRHKVAAQGDLFGSTSTLLPFRSAADCIDWSLKIPSVFGRKRDLKPKTMARIAKGIRRYVIESPRPFIVPLTHTKGGNAASSTEEPIRTLTTAKGGEFALAAPVILPTNHGGGEDRVHDPLDPAKTLTCAPRGEQAIASAFLKPRYGERDGQEPRALDIDGPAPAMVPTGNGGDLIAVHLGRQFGTNVSGRDIAEPHPTAMTDGAGGKSQVVAATLRSGAIIGVGGRAGQSAPRALNDALGTATAKGDKAIATAFLEKTYGKSAPASLEPPLPTVVGKEHLSVVAPIIDKYYKSGVASDAADPFDTATGTARFGLGAAYIEQANGGGILGRSAEAPFSTTTASGAQQRLVECRLAEIEAEDGPKRRAVLEFLWEHFGGPTEAEWADPLATAQGHLRFGLVIIDGVVFQIVDIGMRMLVPRELYRAQGFPDDYKIEFTFKLKPLTKTAQTRMAGNSVCPRMAQVLAEAFAPPGMAMRLAA